VADEPRAPRARELPAPESVPLVVLPVLEGPEEAPAALEPSPGAAAPTPVEPLAELKPPARKRAHRSKRGHASLPGRLASPVILRPNGPDGPRLIVPGLAPAPVRESPRHQRVRDGRLLDPFGGGR